MMRHYILAICLTCLTFLPATGQTSRGRMVITEGRRYMVAFPQVWTAPTEKPLPQPMQLLISSRVKTSVRIQSPAGVNDAAKMDKEYTVEPNKVLRVPISTAYMNVKSQARKGYGISITSKHPITVSTLQAWQGNGETAQHLPVESWGTSYYSMNFYQDRYGFPAMGYQYRPSQILVIADQDSTVVTYSPTVPTEGGIDAPSVAKGASQSITLMRGETFLIKSLIDTSMSRDSSSDLSGTSITSTKPIAVVSGHTKVSTPRMPDILVPNRPDATEASMVRNNVHEVMHPTTMAGRTFVTLPVMYTPLRVVGQNSTNYGIGDDRGDVIRFIALEDNTRIQCMSQDGSGFDNVFTLQKGETQFLPAHEQASLWNTTAPVLVGQYGKSYAKVAITQIKAGDGSADEVLGRPTVEVGMPMLQMVPPTDRWITYATFCAPEGMDDFLNIVFKTSEISAIMFDGRSLATVFGAAVRPLKGTEYAFIRTPIASGNHTITSLSDTVRWMAWNYSSLDGLQQGRAYGTAVGIDLTMACPGDSLLDRAENSGCLETHVTTWNSSDECGSICMIYALDLFNTSLIESEDFQPGDSIVDYHVHVGDSTKPASAVVRTLSSSGSFIDRTFEYVPDSIYASASVHDFGSQSALASSTDTLVLTNPYPNRPISVTRIFMLNGDSTFSIEGVTTPLELPPGSNINILVICKNLSQNYAMDTLVVRTNCVDWKLT
ncbi:MAG TPA: IgGFc-binding protein, partial [Candidatus Didemnitutus sp.]|nr:IgGFc-binding protein [Candidatus Didemnitutus sp.]